jgi:hypothetical protein
MCTALSYMRAAFQARTTKCGPVRECTSFVTAERRNKQFYSTTSSLSIHLVNRHSLNDACNRFRDSFNTHSSSCVVSQVLHTTLSHACPAPPDRSPWWYPYIHTPKELCQHKLQASVTVVTSSERDTTQRSEGVPMQCITLIQCPP